MIRKPFKPSRSVSTKSVAWQFHDTNRESHCRTRHIQIRTMYRRTVNKMTWSNPRYNTALFYFSVWVFETPNEQVSIYHEQACEREYFPEYLQRAMRTGNGFNKIMRTGNGFNTVICIYYLDCFIIWCSDKGLSITREIHTPYSCCVGLEHCALTFSSDNRGKNYVSFYIFTCTSSCTYLLVSDIKL